MTTPTFKAPVQTTSSLEKHTIKCPVIGAVDVYVQGTRSSKEVIIMTVHDLGCNHTMYSCFVEHPRMIRLKERTVWLHVDLPGQGDNSADLPADYQFPTMQKIGEDLVHILDEMKVKEVVCFGEGAGANILARFAMSHIERVLGILLLHTTGTTAGFLDSLKDKAVNRKLEHIGMTPSAEAYLLLHRFGVAEFSKAKNSNQLNFAIENYQDKLRTKANPKNLKKFVESFLKRTNIADNIKKLKCPVLLITGQKSVFNSTTRSLHHSILKTCCDKAKVEYIEVAEVANVLEERPDKMAESLQYFLQGLGLVSSLPMHNVSRTVPPPLRIRSMSMVEYDTPASQRNLKPSSPVTNTPVLEENA